MTSFHLKHGNSINSGYFDIYEQDKFHAQLRSMKKVLQPGGLDQDND